jgi:esterase/lipase
MTTWRQWLRRRLREDAGLISAEYAVVCLAAVAFGGVLLKVLTSETVQAALASVVRRALG